MKRASRIFLTVIGIFAVFIYFNLYFMIPGFIIKDEIQDVLDEQFDKKFQIVEIQNSYSSDFLHEANGYELELKDDAGTKFKNVFIQKNAAQGKWIFFRGTDVTEEYNKAKLNI